ncbi:MAG: dTDP-glucose 4,6-dehydratase [bacterium]
MKTVLVTGGAGFIGSHFAHTLLQDKDCSVIVFDLLTYAGRRENLDDLETHPRFQFVQGDIRDRKAVDAVMAQSQWVVHFAAETHNDRAILDAGEFVLTDVFGTYTLLESARSCGIERFLHVSTDEVYGSIEDGRFSEDSRIEPNMPYAASKAGGELMARAYFKTHGLPLIIARPSNTFGPNQYPEKMMPLFITNAIDDEPLPIYGQGQQIRDWLYVLDNCSALKLILEHAPVGEVYNVGANEEHRNIDVALIILELLGKPKRLIQHVADRPGHDCRYALNADKLGGLGWKPQFEFNKALENTVQWYVNNQQWWRAIKEKQIEYQAFTKEWYKDR